MDMWKQGVRQRFADLDVRGIIGSWKLVVFSVIRSLGVAIVGVGTQRNTRGVPSMQRDRRSYRSKWITKLHMQKQLRFTESQWVNKGKSRRGSGQEKVQGEW